MIIMKMNKDNQLKYLQDIIDRLIFSNMTNGIEPLSLSLNFGIYEIKFQGNEKSSLADAAKYFKEQIALITKDWSY